MADIPTSTPVPDPTELTIDALQREIANVRRELEMRQTMREREHESLKEIIDTRLNGIDRATELLSATVNRTPTEITKEIGHLRGILEEKLSSVEVRFVEQDRLTSTQFKERDTRTEREARDNKLAVDAAFAAQEKQAVAQNEGNQLAINKSEGSTAETIKTNMDLTKSEINALRKSSEDREQRQREVDEDMKKRLGSIESALVGISSAGSSRREVQTDSRSGSTLVLAVIGTLLAVVVAASAIIPIFLGK